MLQFMGSQRAGHDRVAELSTYCVPGFMHIFCKLCLTDFSQKSLNVHTVILSITQTEETKACMCVC